MSNSLDRLIAEYKSLPAFTLIDSGLNLVIGTRHLDLLAKVFNIEVPYTFYDYWANGVAKGTKDYFLQADLICRYEKLNWQGRLLPCQIVVTICNYYYDDTTIQSQFAELDNIVITSLSDVKATIDDIMKHPRIAGMNDIFQRFLTITLVNCYIRQLNYPTLIGTKTVTEELTLENLETDLTESLEIWCHYFDDKIACKAKTGDLADYMDLTRSPNPTAEYVYNLKI